MDRKISERVISCVFEVSNELGAGFLESVYEHALCIEMKRNEIAYQRQKPIVVTYKREIVGDYVADIIVENRLLLELKALSGLTRQHEAQVMNYLKATGINVGLLINFGTPKASIRRIVKHYEDTERI